VIKSATALASDRFIVYSTWKWAVLQNKTGGKPVYLYIFSHPRPPMVNADEQAGLAGGVIKKTDTSAIKVPQPVIGASHASEIEYAMGNLAGNTTYAWTQDDYKVSNEMEDYFANFIKTFNPNGSGLPEWPVINTGGKTMYMHIDLKPESETLNNVERYYFLDTQYQNK
jgi:para-nitrobenzyl esterase